MMRFWPTTRSFCRLGLLLSCWLLSAPVVAAQTPCPNPCLIEVGKPLTFDFTPSVVDATHGPATGYRLYVDTLAPTDLSLATTQTVSVAVSALGPHTLALSAFNVNTTTQAIQESGKSPAVTFTLVTPSPPPPGIPSNLRLLIQVTIAENGSFSFKVVGVESGSK